MSTRSRSRVAPRVLRDERSRCAPGYGWSLVSCTSHDPPISGPSRRGNQWFARDDFLRISLVAFQRIDPEVPNPTLSAAEKWPPATLRWYRRPGPGIRSLCFAPTCRLSNSQLGLCPHLGRPRPTIARKGGFLSAFSNLSVPEGTLSARAFGR